METTIKSYFFTITGKYVEHNKNYLELTPKCKESVSYEDTTLNKIVLEFTDDTKLTKKYWVKCNIQQMFIVLVNTRTGPIMMCDTFTNTIINLINNSMVMLIETTHKESITLPEDVYESLITKYGTDSVLTIQMYDTARRLYTHIDVLNKELERILKQDDISLDDTKYAESIKNNITKVMIALDKLMSI